MHKLRSYLGLKVKQGIAEAKAAKNGSEPGSPDQVSDLAHEREDENTQIPTAGSLSVAFSALSSSQSPGNTPRKFDHVSEPKYENEPARSSGGTMCGEVVSIDQTTLTELAGRDYTNDESQPPSDSLVAVKSGEDPSCESVMSSGQLADISEHNTSSEEGVPVDKLALETLGEANTEKYGISSKPVVQVSEKNFKSEKDQENLADALNHSTSREDPYTKTGISSRFIDHVSETEQMVQVSKKNRGSEKDHEDLANALNHLTSREDPSMKTGISSERIDHVSETKDDHGAHHESQTPAGSSDYTMRGEASTRVPGIPLELVDHVSEFERDNQEEKKSSSVFLDVVVSGEDSTPKPLTSSGSLDNFTEPSHENKGIEKAATDIIHNAVPGETSTRDLRVASETLDQLTNPGCRSEGCQKSAKDTFGSTISGDVPTQTPEISPCLTDHVSETNCDGGAELKSTIDSFDGKMSLAPSVGKPAISLRPVDCISDLSSQIDEKKAPENNLDIAISMKTSIPKPGISLESFDHLSEAISGNRDSGKSLTDVFDATNPLEISPQVLGVSLGPLGHETHPNVDNGRGQKSVEDSFEGEVSGESSTKKPEIPSCSVDHDLEPNCGEISRTSSAEKHGISQGSVNHVSELDSENDEEKESPTGVLDIKDYREASAWKSRVSSVPLDHVSESFREDDDVKASTNINEGLILRETQIPGTSSESMDHVSQLNGTIEDNEKIPSNILDDTRSGVSSTKAPGMFSGTSDHAMDSHFNENEDVNSTIVSSNGAVSVRKPGIFLGDHVSETYTDLKEEHAANVDALDGVTSREADTRKRGIPSGELNHDSEPCSEDEGRTPSESSSGGVSEDVSVSYWCFGEEIFGAVKFKFVEECQELLSDVKDINMRWENGSTLLECAVEEGKLDWTERLLWMGSDPSLRHGEGHTALILAKDMCVVYPLDSDRKVILRLVELASKLGGKGCTASCVNHGSETGAVTSRNDARSKILSGAGESSSCLHESSSARGLDGSDARVKPRGGDGSGRNSGSGSSHASSSHPRDKASPRHVVAASSLSRENTCFRSNVEERLDQLTSMLIEMRQSIDALSTETASLKEDTETLVDNASIRGTAISELRTEVASIKGDLMTELKEVKLESMALGVSCRRQVQEVKESVEKVLERMVRWDEHQRMPQSSATSLAEEDLTPKAGTEEVEEAESKPDPPVCPVVYDQCVHALVAMSECLGTSEDREWLRDYYQDMLSLGPLTSCILKFIRGQKKIKIMVDFKNSDIGVRWPALMDINGVVCNNSRQKVRSHCSRRNVYVAAKVRDSYTEDLVVGWLTIALARMSIFLVFNNKCKPYFIGSKEVGKYKKIVTEAEEMLRRVGPGNCDWYIRDALECKSRDAREIALISAVPGIIAHHGYEVGVEILSKELPSILKYYQEHVVTKFW